MRGRSLQAWRRRLPPGEYGPGDLFQLDDHIVDFGGHPAAEHGPLPLHKGAARRLELVRRRARRACGRHGLRALEGQRVHVAAHPRDALRADGQQRLHVLTGGVGRRPEVHGDIFHHILGRRGIPGSGLFRGVRRRRGVGRGLSAPRRERGQHQEQRALHAPGLGFLWYTAFSPFSVAADPRYRCLRGIPPSAPRCRPWR